MVLGRQKENNGKICMTFATVEAVVFRFLNKSGNWEINS